MLKKIELGSTNFTDLHLLFGLKSHDELQKRKAKLFPVGNTDSEIATTSIFLASLSAVKEYREELLLNIGIKQIKTRNVQLHVYTELYNSDNGDRPDGLIVITSGKNNPIVEWICFVEAKVKDNLINEVQIEKYVEFARGIGINAIVTISNYLVTTPFDSPIKLKKKRNFNLYHWSWTYLKVMASRLNNTNSVADDDHAFILHELRRYFDSHNNLNSFTNMGKEWKICVDKIHMLKNGRKIDNDTLVNIINSYKQEEKDIGLQLTDRSDRFIELVNKKDRTEKMGNTLQKGRIITSQYSIDGDKKHNFFIEIDFLKRSVKCYAKIEIHKGKAKGQTSALIRKLEDESGYADNILINAFYKGNKSLRNDVSLMQLISEKTNSEPYSILDTKMGDEIKYYEIKTYDLFGKDFISTKRFITKLEDVSYRFLTQVMEHVK